ncbi:MAG: DUF2726 domain-containing protein [Burkholderiaceae bacterium]|nr:DUF2726 domain-containing protein [Burkholderiaceae bacterium]
MQTTLLWTLALLLVAILSPLLVLWVKRRPAADNQALPSEWAVAARPVFNTDERRIYRLLREALPHHVLLSKLPLVRFCQPTDAKEVRYWYELLGTIHVSFVVCSPNGRVLAALDLDTGREPSQRSLQIKQSVLAACRIRYLRCTADNLPSVAELQLLVPFSNTAARGPQPAPSPVGIPGTGMAKPAAAKRGERNALWQDSTVFQDSFFAPDNRFDSLSGSDFPQPGAIAAAKVAPSRLSAVGNERQRPEPDYAHEDAPDDIVGIVVDGDSPRVAVNR